MSCQLLSTSNYSFLSKSSPNVTKESIFNVSCQDADTRVVSLHIAKGSKILMVYKVKHRDFCRPIRRPGRGQEKLPKASHQFFLRLRLARLYVNTSFNQVRAVPPCLVSCEPSPLAGHYLVNEPKVIFIPQQGLHQRNVPWNQPRSNYNQPNFMCVEVSDNGRCKVTVFHHSYYGPSQLKTIFFSTKI
ncbi:hypothetical protein J6590_091115 [Homalodisca vitripennis]|nr:hypothetical protein J6590_091115 [Homalodisca vitripennis]